MKKGKIFFNIIIIITVIALISVIGYMAYYHISNYMALKDAEEAVAEFEKSIIVVEIDDEPQENIQVNEIVEEPSENTNTVANNAVTQTRPNKTSSNVSYRGYNMIGTIQIPKTNVKAPIVDKVTVQSIAAAVATLYGPGLNKVGNTVLVAHNYRNGTFFSNNKKLVVGDKIYITDSSGRKIEYTIYKTYTTDEMDFSYATRDTEGKKEISLSTCTTDPTKRLVIWARVD